VSQAGYGLDSCCALHFFFQSLNQTGSPESTSIHCLHWGLQIPLAVDSLVKSQRSHWTPNELNFLDPNTSQIRGHLHQHQLLILNLSNCTIKVMSKTLLHKRKKANFSLKIETLSMRRAFPVRKSRSIFIWREIREFSSAMSSPNGLLSQKLCHYLNRACTLNDILMSAVHWMTYLDRSKPNLVGLANR